MFGKGKNNQATFCPQCGAPVEKNASFCTVCGSPLVAGGWMPVIPPESEMQQCPYCGEMLETDANFCVKCGMPIIRCKNCNKPLQQEMENCPYCNTYQREMPQTKPCPQCGRSIPMDAMMCECGWSAYMPPQTKPCPQCGRFIPIDATICECGWGNHTGNLYSSVKLRGKPHEETMKNFFNPIDKFDDQKK